MADFDERAFAPVHKGWNVWVVQQSQDLDFDPLMVGVDRDRRLRIWVEDEIRKHASGAELADPLALKGSMVDILSARPEGLKSEQNRDQVPGDLIVLDGPVDLRTVRFFNRGAPSRLPWPHDDDYLLDEVLEPDEKNPATAGPGPSTTAGDVGKPLVEAGETVLAVGAGVGILWVLWKMFGGRK